MAFWQIKSDFQEVFSGIDHAYAPIDGLRALAILMVMAFHSVYIAHVVLPAEDFVHWVSHLPGGLSVLLTFDKAVDGFFVISGFLLGGSLIRQQQNRAFRGYWVFYRKRLYRILPLFLLALLLYGAGSWHGDWYSLLVNLLFIENNFNDATKLIPVGWSLSIEMQFYLVLPLLVVFTGRSLPYWLLGLLFLALVLRTFGVFADGRFYEISFLDYLAGKADAALLLDNIYYPTWMRFGALILGVLAAWLWIVQPHWLQQQRSRLFWLGVTALLLGFLYPDFTQMQVDYPLLNAWSLILHRYVFALGVMAMMLVALLPQNDQQPHQAWLTRALSWKGFKSWSEMVYPLYLFHFPMLAVAAVVVLGTTQISEIGQIFPSQLLGILVLGALFSWVLSLILHLLIEKPFIRRGRA